MQEIVDLLMFFFLHIYLYIYAGNVDLCIYLFALLFILNLYFRF